jgi:hypothetical protein
MKRINTSRKTWITINTTSIPAMPDAPSVIQEMVLPTAFISFYP